MNTNLVIDPIQLQAAVDQLPPTAKSYVTIALAVLGSALTLAGMIGRAWMALKNDAPVLRSIFMGSVHATNIPAQLFQPKGQSDEAQKLVPAQKSGTN